MGITEIMGKLNELFRDKFVRVVGGWYITRMKNHRGMTNIVNTQPGTRTLYRNNGSRRWRAYPAAGNFGWKARITGGTITSSFVMVDGSARVASRTLPKPIPPAASKISAGGGHSTTPV